MRRLTKKQVVDLLRDLGQELDKAIPEPTEQEVRESVDRILNRLSPKRRCYNCRAEVPSGKGGTDPDGRFVCCAHCIFNPLGCRCKYGEFEVAETRQEY